MTTSALDLSLVIDIGKSHAKLLMLDVEGHVVERFSRINGSVMSPLGYPALDLSGLEQWMKSVLGQSTNTQRCGHVIATTHGAAFVALGSNGLAWPPIDYEFEDVETFAFGCAEYLSVIDDFQHSLSPMLPAGLNAANQLHWMQHHHPDAWSRTTCLLPYPQYWAWLLSGVACSEVTSLGCHTHLWLSAHCGFSKLAEHMGWDELFAPLKSAWAVLGMVQPHIARDWGLPAQCQVHVGVHDSNACLVRYLNETPFQQTAEALTIVSSGTWTVLMAPGASSTRLKAKLDMLGNVDVTGRMTPTARFMGGREFANIANGAAPGAANVATLISLMERSIFAMPSFAHQGGPFAHRAGDIEWGPGQPMGLAALVLDASERATLATVYCAQMTAWLVNYLWPSGTLSRSKVIVEGPLATNTMYMTVLQALLVKSICLSSTDELEGTARGAWLLSRWEQHSFEHALQKAVPLQIDGLLAYNQKWLDAIDAY